MLTIFKALLATLLLAGTVSAQVVTGGGSGGGITSVATNNSGLAGSNAIYPNAPPYNISFDGRPCLNTAATWTNTSTTVTLDGVNCIGVASDVGKVAYGTNCNAGVVGCIAGVASRPVGVITVASATSLTVTGNSTGACAAGCQLWIFTDDRSKWCCAAGSVDAAIRAASSCVAVISPAGVSPLPFGFGLVGPPQCLNTTVNSIGATIDAGNNFEGQGQAVTIFLIPSDNSFASCTGSGASSNGCLFSAFSNLSNFTVTGAGFGATGNNSKTVIDPASHANFIHDLTLVAFGSGDTNLFGFAIPFSNKNDSVYVDQFGHIPCSFAGINTMSLSNSFCGDSSGPAAQAAGSGGTIRTTNVYFGQTTGTIQINLGGTNYTWYSTNDQSYGSVGAGGAQFYCNGAGDTYHISGFISLNPALGIDLNQATCKAYVRDSVIIGSTNSLSTQGVALTTGGYFNEGGNTYTGAFTASMQPSCPTVTGAGASGSCAMSGTAFNDSGTLRITVAGAGPAALGTVTMNFIGTFPNPSCQFTPALTGGGVWNARATVFISTRSNTAPVITWDNNGAALTATTWDIDYTCTSK